MDKKENVMFDTLTGEEFKTLIERFTKDGKVNTIPEIIEKFKDVPEDVELEDWVRQIAEECSVDPEVLQPIVDAAFATNRVTPEDLEHFVV